MGTARVTRPWDGLLPMLMDWVGSDDGQKIILAVELILREGAAVTEFLIARAAEPTAGDVLKFRLLDLAARIGGHRDAATTPPPSGAAETRVSASPRESG